VCVNNNTEKAFVHGLYGIAKLRERERERETYVW